MNTPTKITLVRICLIPVFVAVFLIDAIPYGKFIALGIFFFSSITDWLDGYLARKNNLVTDLGKFLDPIADKLLVTAALILVLLYPLDGFLIPLVVFAITIIARELIISGFRIVASSKNIVIAADKLGKIKTFLQMSALLLLIPFADIAALNETAATIIFYIGFGLLCAATLMTVVSVVNYIVKNREVLK